MVPALTSSPALAAIGAALDAGGDRHRAVDDLAVLLHQHRVGTLRQERAGEDADRACAARVLAQRMTGGGAAHDGQHGLAAGHEIGEAHGIAVDRDIVGGRHVARRDQRLGEDAAGRVFQRNALGFGDAATSFSFSSAKRGGRRHQLAAEGEAIVTELRHGPARRCEDER